MHDVSAGGGAVPGPEDQVRVLHVDDDEAFCEVTARNLERVDESLTVASETEPSLVLDRLADGSFDAVVSDYEMSGGDGLGLLRRVRERHGDLPFLLFTGSGNEAVASEAIAAGVTDYLRKGADPEQYTVLANRIRNAVATVRQRARTEELERVNGLIRQLNRRIARLDSAPAIERTVCETIAGAEPYRFAWVGDRDAATDEITVRASGGDAAAYLDEIDIRADETPEGLGPAGRAIRTGEPQVAQDIPTDDTFAPWQPAAAEYRFRSVAVLPLRGPDSSHGLLAVYADRRNAFDDRELTILQELAETIGGALEGAIARRRLERRERELERYENIVEASGDPVYVIGPEGRFQFVNDRLVEMTGHDEAALLGQHVGIVLPPEDVETGEELIRSVLGSGRQRATYEMTVVTADGDRIACENHVSLLPFEDSFRGTVGVVRDITQRRERERELERQNERLEEFASVVSHDLQNPLNVVQGSLELAEANGDLDELDRARRGLDRMRTLIDDLLTLAREGEEVAAFQPVALDRVATDAWSVVEAPGADLRVTTDRTVLADENRLRQLLENLFANAVEHSSTSPASQARQDAVEHGSTGDRTDSDEANADGGTGQEATDGGTANAVTVTVGDLTEPATGFFVADDGPGIPPERREDVFERAYSTSEAGTGFGLRIVERIAEAHGWSVALTESATGGARFEFTGVDIVEG